MWNTRFSVLALVVQSYPRNLGAPEPHSRTKSPTVPSTASQKDGNIKNKTIRLRFKNKQGLARNKTSHNLAVYMSVTLNNNPIRTYLNSQGLSAVWMAALYKLLNFGGLCSLVTVCAAESTCGQNAGKIPRLPKRVPGVLKRGQEILLL